MAVADQDACPDLDAEIQQEIGLPPVTADTALASGPLVTLSDKDGPSTGSHQQPRWKAPMIILIDLAPVPSSAILFEKMPFMMRT